MHPTLLLKTITKSNKFFKNIPQPLKWGIDNEKIAFEKYKAKSLLEENTHLSHCGLVISPKWPWLGCSLPCPALQLQILYSTSAVL